MLEQLLLDLLQAKYTKSFFKDKIDYLEKSNLIPHYKTSDYEDIQIEDDVLKATEFIWRKSEQELHRHKTWIQQLKKGHRHIHDFPEKKYEELFFSRTPIITRGQDTIYCHYGNVVTAITQREPPKKDIYQVIYGLKVNKRKREKYKERDIKIYGKVVEAIGKTMKA